jgi:hypothetical protein
VPGTYRRGTLAGVTVCQELIEGYPKRPDIRCIVELTLFQALWGIPGERGHLVFGTELRAWEHTRLEPSPGTEGHIWPQEESHSSVPV